MSTIEFHAMIKDLSIFLLGKYFFTIHLTTFKYTILFIQMVTILFINYGQYFFINLNILRKCEQYLYDHMGTYLKILFIISHCLELYSLLLLLSYK